MLFSWNAYSNIPKSNVPQKKEWKLSLSFWVSLGQYKKSLMEEELLPTRAR